MINITPRIRGLLVAEMREYGDIDAYLSDLSQSYVWGDDWDNPDPDIPAERVQYLADLWRYYHMTTAELLHASGYTAPQLADALGIPYTTVAGWVSGKHKAPQYIIAMAAELLEFRRARE